MKYPNWKMMIMAITLLALFLAACSSKEAQGPQALKDAELDQNAPMTQTQTSSQETEPGTAPETRAAMPDDKEIVIIGRVISGEGALILTTGKGEFAIEGKDLSQMIGSTVKVTGALQEKEGIRTIRVTDVVNLQ